MKRCALALPPDIDEFFRIVAFLHHDVLNADIVPVSSFTKGFAVIIAIPYWTTSGVWSLLP